MLVVSRKEERYTDCQFRDLRDFLQHGDCLALNDSKVLPARLYGHREGFSGQIEVLLVKPSGPDPLTWLALARPGRKLRSGERILFSPRLSAEIIGRGSNGERILRFHVDGDLHEAISEVGHTPLPPYIRRPDTSDDATRYQTVYAASPGSVAAPTAGLHFTPELLAAFDVPIARVTLHTGLGTFQPLQSETVEAVRLHSESYTIAPESVAAIRAASRVVAVGTTTVRTLETAASSGWNALCGETDLFISPGFQFLCTGAMLTNFHLPQSSLLILVCSFGGKDLILDAYRHAVAAGYRFYSYGDCMLIV